MDITTLVNSIVNALLSLTATLGNAAILVAIWKTPSLHSATNALLFSLSLSDLGVGLICQPLVGIVLFPKVAELAKQEWALKTSQTLTASLAAVSLVTVTAIGLDKYLAVRLHLRYKELVTTKRTVCFVIVIWMACILTVSFCFWLDGNRGPVAFYATAAPAVVACFLINVFVYQKLYRVCRFHHVRIQDQQVFQDTQLYQRAVNEVRFRKSVKTIFFILLAFICCYLPFCCCACVVSIIITHHVVNSVVHNIFPFTWTIVFANSTINPILLYFQLTELRLAIKRIVKKACCRRASA